MPLFKKAAPTKAQAKAATRVAKCQGGCGKSKLACTCNTNSRRPIKEKVKVTNSRGHQQTVTRNSKTATVDARGNNWCSACSCLISGGRCSNVTCSTRR